MYYPRSIFPFISHMQSIVEVIVDVFNFLINSGNLRINCLTSSDSKNEFL